MRKLLSITRIIWILWILYIFCWNILTLICRRENGTLQITYIGIVVFTIIETVTINPDFIKKTINPTIKGIIPIRLNIIYVKRMIIVNTQNFILNRKRYGKPITISISNLQIFQIYQISI